MTQSLEHPSATNKCSAYWKTVFVLQNVNKKKQKKLAFYVRNKRRIGRVVRLEKPTLPVIDDFHFPHAGQTAATVSTVFTCYFFFYPPGFVLWLICLIENAITVKEKKIYIVMTTREQIEYSPLKNHVCKMHFITQGNGR